MSLCCLNRGKKELVDYIRFARDSTNGLKSLLSKSLTLSVHGFLNSEILGRY